MKGAALLLASSVLVGCVRDAVLENDVQSAQWRARTLATATDPSLAYAALSAELVQLEALYQRAPEDARVRTLLARGYLLMAQGFIELRRLEATASGDAARAEQERKLAMDAEGRAHFYAPKRAPAGQTPPAFERDAALKDAERACAAHDRAAYERVLNEALARPEPGPEARLQVALTRRIAALWLAPPVSARCNFGPVAPP